LEESNRLIKLAKEAQVIAQVGHIERFNPAFLAISPLLNNTKYMEAHRLSPFKGRNNDVSVILDVMIPHKSGIEVAKELRSSNLKTPILMLTALGSVDEKVIGLDAGADDYLVKPFDFKELLARLRVLTKRSNEQIAAPKILVIEDLELDLDRKVARRGGQIIDLTAKEYSLLEYLIRNKNRVISRTEILEKVWSAGFDSTTNVIDVYINFLRKKIDKGFDKKLIHTMVGMGYIIKSVD
jgi:DNA-binding response OmpR family regulator